MEKKSIITSALLSIGVLLAQNNKKILNVKAVVSEKKLTQTTHFEGKNSTHFSNSTLSLQNKKNIKTSYPQIASVSATRFAGSMNMYGVLTSQQKPLQYNSDLDIVTFSHRKSSVFVTSPASNSGSIIFTWSLNRGNTWDSSCVWADGSNLGRYPQGGVYNPAGNTNINLAHFVAAGPVTNSSNWLGNYFASKEYTAAVGGNASAKPSPYTQFIPYGGTFPKTYYRDGYFTITNDGMVRFTAPIVADPNSTTLSGLNTRGAAVFKGTFNAGTFTWSMDSLIPSVTVSSITGNNLDYFAPLMAWDNAGQTGYVVMFGIRQGLTNDSMKSMQPIVYKTTNSGASWTLIPPFNFTRLKEVDDRLFIPTHGLNYALPYFSREEGADVTVDNQGRLHLVCTIQNAYSIHQDTAGFYTYAFNSGGGCGSQNYNFYYGDTHTMPTIMDFILENNNNWNGILVDSMGTEGTAGGNNTCSQWNTAGFDINARIQVSRNDVGDKIFYSWTETDTTVTGHHFNVYPDLYIKGYDVNANTVTNRMLVIGTSATTPTIAQSGIFFHYMSNKAINVGSGTYEIPFTFSGDPTFNGGTNADHYYVKGAQFSMSDFSNTATPLSANSSNSAMNVTKISNAVNVYPNPVKDNTNLSFNLNNASDVRIEIMNTLGQVINSMNISAKAGINVVNVDLSNENAGVYFFNIITNTGKMTGKIIKQ